MPELPEHLQSSFGDDYTIERELGGAGMSRVFVATERALQRKVVIKVLPPELSGGVNIERFRREIQLAAQLQHPHIVPLLTASSNRDVLWFTMPFIEGSSLRSTLERTGRLTARDVVRILHDVVDALAYAHARGVVHRDIKPDNILMSGVHAMVTDFGVAKALSAAIPATVGTTTGVAIGTPAYMAPEQLAADPAADHRVDVYAVGLLAYELLTGKSPFNRNSPQATLAAQLTFVPEAPHRTFTDVPEALSTVVMRCLEKDSSRRYQSAADLLSALNALPDMSSGAVLAKPPTVKRAWYVATAAIALLASAAWVASVTTKGATAKGAEAADSISSASNRALLAANDSIKENDNDRSNNVDSDKAATATVPLVISRAESLAIVAAFQKKQENIARPPAQVATRSLDGTATDSTRSSTNSNARVVIASESGEIQQIDRDVLRREVQRIFADSAFLAMVRVDSILRLLPGVARVEAGDRPRAVTSAMTPLIPPPPEGVTRVVVTPFRSRSPEGPTVTRSGFEIAGYIRRSLARNQTIEVPDLRVTERAFESGDRMVAAWRLRADYVVSGDISTRNDSVVIVVFFNDVRHGRFARAERVITTAQDASRGYEMAATYVTAWIDTVRTVGRRVSR